MARSLVRSIINTSSRREFSTYKFSLAKLSRNQTSSSGAISSTNGVDHQESPSTIIGSSAGSSPQRPMTVWWGPDATTGIMDLNFDLNSPLEENDVNELDGLSWYEMSQVISTPNLGSPTFSGSVGNESTNPALCETLPHPLPTISGDNPSFVGTSRRQEHKTKSGEKTVEKRKKKQASEEARRKKLASTGPTPQRGPWSMDDFRILADAMVKLGAFLQNAKARKKIVSRDQRWIKVSAWCAEEGVIRAPLQCQDKWDNHFPKFKKIRDWDKNVPSGMHSWAQMDPEERVTKGFPRYFDADMYSILEERFKSDILVEPGPILMDSSEATYEQCNGTRSTIGGSSGAVGGGTCDPCTEAVDKSSTGKRRSIREGRTNGIKKDFQDISKNLIDSMERTSQHRSLEQRQHVQELLVVQERHAKAAEEQVAVLHNSMAKMTDLFGAYLARQG